MQSITSDHLNQRNNYSLKTQNQYSPRRRDCIKRHAIWAAVQEWEATLPGKAQETIALLVAEQWANEGGRGIAVNKQNLFRYLKNENGSDKYNRYVMQLASAIAHAMPLEIARKHGLRQGKTDAELVAHAMKESTEAHQARLLGLPVQKQVKETFECLLANAALLPGEMAGLVISNLQTLAPQLF